MAEKYNPEEANEFLHRLRHSAAHVMAEAVLGVYPDAKIAIGPAIDTGFYYDFDLGADEQGRPRTFAPEDLAEIEKRMRQIVAGKHPFAYREVSADEARQLFRDQPYKLELIDGLAKGGIDEYGNESAGPVVISTYRHDTFEDLCRGPHLDHTGQIPPDAFKLMTVAGAYWRGDEHNPMLQRIYGTAWRNKKELSEYLQMLEEAKKRDHRKLGKDLEIFVFDDEVGPGLPLWLPNGGIMIEELETLAKEMELKAGYQRVRTPHLAKEDLFLHSGHLPYYAESMYPPMELEGVRYYVKPMNCPMHHKIFGSRPRSYRDLPLRLAEYGTCYRYEKSGELFGLLRVRSMQMNDAHIYCAEEQFEQEFMAVVGLYLSYFKLFGIEKYVMRFSTHHREGPGQEVRGQRAAVAEDRGDGAPGHDQRRRAFRRGRRRSRLLRAEDRRAGVERHRQGVHAGDQPGRLCAARPFQPDLHEPGGRRGDAAVHPPCAAEHARAADRLPDRALCRQLPGLAGARTGARHSDHRRAQRLRDRHRRSADRAQACAPERIPTPSA